MQILKTLRTEQTLSNIKTNENAICEFFFEQKYAYLIGRLKKT